MSAQVAVYVQGKYAKPAYAVESHNVRAWPGLEMVCHALRHAGIEVDYCSSATAGRYTGIFYRGNRFWAAESRGTASLPTVILDSLVLRGIEDDSETIAMLAGSTKFRSASMAHKTAMLERHVDVSRLFGAYPWDPPSPRTATAGLRTLPTRYLAAYTPADKLKGMDAVARQRAGKPWPDVPEGGMP